MANSRDNQLFSNVSSYDNDAPQEQDVIIFNHGEEELANLIDKLSNSLDESLNNNSSNMLYSLQTNNQHADKNQNLFIDENHSMAPPPAVTAESQSQQLYQLNTVSSLINQTYNTLQNSSSTTFSYIPFSSSNQLINSTLVQQASSSLFEKLNSSSRNYKFNKIPRFYSMTLEQIRHEIKEIKELYGRYKNHPRIEQIFDLNYEELQFEISKLPDKPTIQTFILDGYFNKNIGKMHHLIFEKFLKFIDLNNRNIHQHSVHNLPLIKNKSRLDAIEEFLNNNDSNNNKETNLDRLNSSSTTNEDLLNAIEEPLDENNNELLQSQFSSYKASNLPSLVSEKSASPSQVSTVTTTPPHKRTFDLFQNNIFPIFSYKPLSPSNQLINTPLTQQSSLSSFNGLNESSEKITDQEIPHFYFMTLEKIRQELKEIKSQDNYLKDHAKINIIFGISYETLKNEIIKLPGKPTVTNFISDNYFNKAVSEANYNLTLKDYLALPMLGDIKTIKSAQEMSLIDIHHHLNFIKDKFKRFDKKAMLDLGVNYDHLATYIPRLPNHPTLTQFIDSNYFNKTIKPEDHNMTLIEYLNKYELTRNKYILSKKRKV